MYPQEQPLITVTDDDIRLLDTIILRLEENPPEPERTWLKLYKDAIESDEDLGPRADHPIRWRYTQREVQR